MDDKLKQVEYTNVFDITTLKLLSEIAEEACLKEMKFAADRPLEDTDVTECKFMAEKCLSCINNAVSKLMLPSTYNSVNIPKQNKKHAISLFLILCSEHSSKDDIWTTAVTLQLSSTIIEGICAFCSCGNERDLINQELQLVPTVFNILRQKLETETWKFYPAAVSSYAWHIHRIEMPYMGQYLHLAMPTTLIILDDYLSSNRIIALRCLNCIVNNITKDEFNWYCLDDSLYRTLEPMIYNLEPASVKPLVSCLASVLNKKISNLQKLNWTHYDDIMSVWLPSMEMEQKLDLRAAHIECLPIFLEAMGLSCVRWSPKLIRIFEEYATFHEEQEKCFNAMHMFILQTWKRTPNHFSQLITILLKALYDAVETENHTSENKQRIISSIVKCFNLLKTVTPDQMNKLSCDIKTNSSFNQTLKSYF